MVNINI